MKVTMVVNEVREYEVNEKEFTEWMEYEGYDMDDPDEIIPAMEAYIYENIYDDVDSFTPIDGQSEIKEITKT